MLKKQKKLWRQQFEEQYGDVAMMLAEKNLKFIKPKPAWVPPKIWIWMLSRFIWIKK